MLVMKHRLQIFRAALCKAAQVEEALRTALGSQSPPELSKLSAPLMESGQILSKLTLKLADLM